MYGFPYPGRTFVRTYIRAHFSLAAHTAAHKLTAVNNVLLREILATAKAVFVVCASMLALITEAHTNPSKTDLRQPTATFDSDGHSRQRLFF